MENIKPGTWLALLVEVYNELGGEAPYSTVYSLAKEKRIRGGSTWTSEARATIRRTVEDHAESSRNFRGKAVFFSVEGHGRGVWGLLPEYRTPDTTIQPGDSAYGSGLEGIVKEQSYLRRSRDPRLVEARKLRDNFTCQACGFRLEVAPNKFVVDVHHLDPIGSVANVVLTSIEDLVCLCPNCHRVAHSTTGSPMPLDQVRQLVLCS